MSGRRCEAAASTTGTTPSPAMRASWPTSARGFSLIEAVTVVAIIGIVSGIVIGGIELLRKSGAFTGASGDIITGLRKTRAEAFGRGTYTAFIIDTVGGRWWGIEAPNGINLSTFNPSAPGKLIISGSLPSGTVFGPTGGYGAALPAPFSAIPTLPTQSPNLNFCSFCNTDNPNQGFGEMLFDIDRDFARIIPDRGVVWPPRRGTSIRHRAATLFSLRL